MSGFLGKIGSFLKGDLLKGATNLIDEIVTTKEEKEQLKLKFQEMVNNHERAVYELVVADRNSARDMYKDDSSLQKAFAITFLVAYLILTIVMLVGAYQLAKDQLDLPNWVISLVSTIWGGMSTKVNTITDFLFGGSKPSNQPKTTES